MEILKKVSTSVDESVNKMWEEFKTKPVRSSIKFLLFLLIINWIYDKFFVKE